MIVIKFIETIRRLLHLDEVGSDKKTRKYTRHMIKKYGKTLRRLSYE